MRDRIRMWQHPDDPMNDDPNMDGASLLIVGEQILSAGRERPALGLALARARERPSDPGMWYIGTRMAHQRAATTSDVRFEGGAPPLSALARRIEGGEFGRWFVELKADADAGRVHQVRTIARSGVRLDPLPSASSISADAAPLGVGSDDVVTQPMQFPRSTAVPAIRARSGPR